MTFDQVRPIVEARLYAYAALKAEYPDTPISSIYEGLGTIIEGGENTSPQERWAMRHANELRNAMIIEKMLGALPDEERQLIEMRYFEYANEDTFATAFGESADGLPHRDRAHGAACGFDLLGQVETL